MKISFFLADISSAEKFDRVALGVFDAKISPTALEVFLNDERHHIALASHQDAIVGFVSAVDYVHPDKPRELWINEVGVAPDWQGQGIAKRLLALMLKHGRDIGCAEAWVLTEPQNAPAIALYRSVAKAGDPDPVTISMHSFKLA